MYRQRRVLYPLVREEGTRRRWHRVLCVAAGAFVLAQTGLAPIAAFAATIQTDLFVYQNGDTVTVTGDGFGGTETVGLVTTDPAGAAVDQGTAATDANGSFTYQFVLNVTTGGLYTVAATGETSGLTASTQFDPQDKTTLTESNTPSTATYGSAVTVTGTLIDKDTSQPIANAAIDVGTFANSNCNANQLVVLSSTTTSSSGTFSASALPPVSAGWLGASYAGVPQAHQPMTACNPVTVNVAATSTTASLSLGTISTSGNTVVSWTVASTSGVTGSTATGTGTVVKDSGPGTLSCSPPSVAVSAGQTTGSGFSFTAGTAQRFTCSANATGTYTLHVHFADGDGNYSASDGTTLTLTVTTPTAALSVASATGTYGGTVNLQATLTAAGTPLAGKSISFTLNGTSVGSATTNASGVAGLTGVVLGAINAGTYGTGVGASFAGDSSYTAASANNGLQVNKAPLTVTANSAARAYGAANPPFTATIAGFVNGQTLGTSGVTGSPSLTTTATATSPVGTYTISAAIGSLASANYSFTFVKGTLTVGPVSLTITADTKTKVYGAALPTLTVSYSGFVNGDTSASLTTQPAIGTTATTASHVGSYAITASGAVDPNYTISYVAGTLTVTPATLTITAVSKSKVYGAALPPLTVSYSGFVNGDSPASLTTQPTISTTATAASHVDGGPYTITASGAADPDYSTTYIAGSLTVTPAPLTIKADDKSKAYGAVATPLTASYSGFVNGDSASSLATVPALSTPADATSHVGAYSITASGATDDDYAISYQAGTLTVTPVALKITAGDKTKAYGAPVPALTVSYSGFVNGDSSASLSTQASITTTGALGSPVGTYPITASGAVDPDYTISYVAGTLTVSAASLVITADDQSKVYGAALPALTVTYSGLVNGDTPASLTTQPAISTTATAASHVGAYPITASGAADANYTISYVAGTLTVTPAALTITADSKSKEYGAALPTLTVSYSGFVNGDSSASLTSQPAVSTTATTASHVDVGPYTITASGAVDGDYTISYVAGSLTVTPAPLTITADDKSKAYGAALPALTASYTGFVNGDTATSLTMQPTLSTTATSASHVGSYSITASGAADTDYTISYTAGTLTISPVALTITADDKSKPYGAALPALTASYSGFVNGDAAPSLTTQPTLNTTATAASHVAGSPYAITASGAADPDYTISYVAGTLTVTPVGLRITADDQNKAYGAALPALTVSYAGFVNGDTAASLATLPTLGTTATAASHVAGNPYSITASGAADSDYTISYFAGTLTVTPVGLTITADSKTKAYGAPLPPLTASYAGFVNGDTPASLTTPPTVTTSATASSHFSGNPYSITAAGALDTDYTISYVAGTLTVTPVGLTITADDQTKPYGAAVPALTASYAGLVNGDSPASLDVAPTLSTTASKSSHVGTYTITATGAVDSDYTISYVDGTLTVTPAALQITAEDKAKDYGAALPVLTVSYSGFVLGDNPSSLTTPPAVATTATPSSHVGSYPISASGAVDPDYFITYVAGTLTVNPVPLTITADDQSKVYGAALPGLTASYSGFVNGDSSADLTTQPILSTTATAASHAGSYPIVASGAFDADYVIGYVDGTLTVTPAPLTIAADDRTKAYGDPVPTFTATYTGLVNGDTPASLSTAPTLSTSATAASHVGAYAISAGGAADPDYAISYAAGTLTITPVPLTITADGKSKVYGAALPGLTASYSGFVNGDTAASLTTAPGVTTNATAASHVGSYSITASGAVDPDYTISYVSGTLTVSPAPLTITADDKSKVYGAALPAMTVSYSGFVNGDTSASLTTPPAISTTGDAHSHAGSYPITAFGAADPDYTITYVDGTLTVTPAPLTITADSKTKPYGAPVPALTASYSGFVNGDTSASLTTAPTLTTTATAASHVAGGPYTITASGAADTDYVITYVPGSLTVTPVPLTISADNKTKAYGAPLPALTASYSGFVNGDTAASLATAPTLSTTATATSHVAGSPYTITVSGAVDADYLISYSAGSLTVTPVPLVITADNKSMVLNSGPLPVLTARYATFVNGDTAASLTTQPSLSTTATTSSPAGVYPITVSGAADADYAITYVSGTLSIQFAASTTSCGGSAGRVVLQPVNSDGSSVFKAGSTVPIKFRVCDANGNSIGGSGAVVKAGSDGHMDPVIYATGTNTNPVDETVLSTTPDMDFRWDAANQQWIFNLSTKNLKAGAHYFFRIDLVDGTSIYFEFSTK